MSDAREPTGEPRRRTPLLALLGANGVSTIGNAASTVALSWFVLQTTGSPALMGVAAAAISIGGALSSVLGGPLVDRIGLRRASVVADLGASVAVTAIPVLHLAGALEFWLLVVLVVAMSMVNTQGDTARFALMRPLARRAGMEIERANSADRAIARLGQIGGPLIAGILIALIGPVYVLFVNAATYLVSAVLIASTVPGRLPAEPDQARAPEPASGGYLAQLGEGIRFVRGNRLVLSLVLMATLANLIDIPLFSVIMPVYAQEFYGSPTSLGIVLSAIAGGALLGTVAFGAIGRSWPRRATFLTCLVLAPLVFYTNLVLTPPLVLLVIVAATAGAITGPINPILLSAVQSSTPPHLAGRVFGTLSAIAGAGVPIGAILAGVLVESVGIIPTVGAIGVVYVAAALAMSLNPALKAMDRERVPSTEP